MVIQSGPAAALSAALPRLLLALCAASVLLISNTNAIGVNFGQVSNNLPSNEIVLQLVQTTTIKKLKIYGADPGVLTTFAGSGIDIMIGADNDQVQPLASTAGYALTWAQTNIAAYPNTSIVGVALGNEIFSYQPQLIPFLLPALQNLQAALVSLGLDQKVKLASPNSLGIVAKSFPPSYGEFYYNVGDVMSPILDFFAQTGSQFMVNVYPYFAYAAAPESISLDYVLFNPTVVPVLDNGSGLSYTNMFDAQVDAVYAAMSKLGYSNLSLAVTETGWPSAGDPTEAGASVANAQLFNTNLVKHIESGVGTPAKPGVTVDTYIFALYNEDLKPGPTSERNFGLYNPDGTPVYNSGLTVSPQWYSPPPPAVVSPPAPVVVSPPQSFSPPPPVPALPPVETYSPPPPPSTVLPPIASYSPPPPETYWPPPPPSTVSPPVASYSPPPPETYWPPPPPTTVLPPVASYSPPPPATALPPVSNYPPPYGVAQPPPQGYPPPTIATPPVASYSPPPPETYWPPPPPITVFPPVASYSPPPPATALSPLSSYPPPTGVAQPPPQGYPPPTIATPPVASYSPPPPGVIATPPVASYSPPPPGVIATPPVAGYSPPPPPVVISIPPAPGPAGSSPPPPSIPAAPVPTSPTVPTAPGPAGGSPPPPFIPNAPVPTSPTVPIAPGPGGAQSWCVAKADADPGQLQIALDWACSTGGADCGVLQSGGVCFTPNTLVAHASYAFDSYYQINNRQSWDCFFSDTAELTTVNPSFVACNFP